MHNSGGLPARADDAAEVVVGREIFFASLAHGVVGLDAIHAIAIFEKQLAEKTGA